MGNILIYEPGKGLYEREFVPDYRARIGMGDARNIVVKTGSDVMLTENGELDVETISHSIEQMVELIREGRRVTWVHSGARAAGADYVGKGAEGVSARTLCICGQPRLMHVFHEASKRWPDVRIGQGLIEGMHFQQRRRDEVRNGLDNFHEEIRSLGLVGLIAINANDFAWTGETVYDNDHSAANVCKLVDADLAIYLTNVDGLISGFSTEDERVVNLVYGVNSGLYGLVEDSRSKWGSAGMEGKLRGGMKRILDQRRRGIIANGKRRNVIRDVLDGEDIGTLFCRKDQNTKV